MLAAADNRQPSWPMLAAEHLKADEVLIAKQQASLEATRHVDYSATVFPHHVDSKALNAADVEPFLSVNAALTVLRSRLEDQAKSTTVCLLQSLVHVLEVKP